VSELKTDRARCASASSYYRPCGFLATLGVIGLVGVLAAPTGAAAAMFTMKEDYGYGAMTGGYREKHVRKSRAEERGNAKHQTKSRGDGNAERHHGRAYGADDDDYGGQYRRRASHPYKHGYDADPGDGRIKHRSAGHGPFGDIPTGPLQIIISINQQKLHLYSDGTHVADAPIATGVPGHSTPTGVFSVIDKERYHESNIYSGAPMPYMQRITWSGVALHQGQNLGHPASHGCIRMSQEFASRLWLLPSLGARVIIARPELMPRDFGDPHLFVHKAARSRPDGGSAGCRRECEDGGDRR
jgi:L,D-transpeptidase catalytic domain